MFIINKCFIFFPVTLFQSCYKGHCIALTKSTPWWLGGSVSKLIKLPFFVMIDPIILKQDKKDKITRKLAHFIHTWRKKVATLLHTLQICPTRSIWVHAKGLFRWRTQTVVAEKQKISTSTLKNFELKHKVHTCKFPL